jgi:hypothetical protein
LSPFLLRLLDLTLPTYKFFLKTNVVHYFKFLRLQPTVMDLIRLAITMTATVVVFLDGSRRKSKSTLKVESPFCLFPFSVVARSQNSQWPK